MASAGVAIGRRRRWAPPVTAKVDWSHPAAVGLQAFVANGVDLCGRPVSNAVAHGSASPFGPSRSHASANAFVVPGVRPLQAAGVSFLTVARKTSTAGANPFMAAVAGNGAGHYGYGIYSPSGGSAINWINGGVALVALGLTMNTNQWRCIVATGSAGTQTTVQGWMDGTTGGAKSLTGSTAPLDDFSVGGSNGGTADYWEGEIAVAAVWGCALDQGLAQSLSIDPFQMLRF